jgi:hypothetical protein
VTNPHYATDLSDWEGAMVRMIREPEDLPESKHQRCGMTALDGPLPVSL